MEGREEKEEAKRIWRREWETSPRRRKVVDLV
jgi:hypothetical protein